MCVAIYKPANEKTPSLETLKQCWNANPDGAGFAIFTGDEKYAASIKKGFMTWLDFETAFQKHHLADFPGELFLHFRIATHGGVSPGNTHPFPITEDVKLLKHTNVLTNYALIHNGILPIEPSSKNISDTMELCKRLSQGKFYHNIPDTFRLLTGFIGSNKLAVMTRNGVHLAGEWENIDSVYFSNTLWQHRLMNWQWEDEFRIPDNAELELLHRGVCPDCDGEIVQDRDEFYCMDCDAIWTIAQESYAL